MSGAFCLVRLVFTYKKNVSYNKNNLCLEFDDPNWNQFED